MLCYAFAAMRWIVLAIIGVALVVNGQEPKSHSGAHKTNPATASKAASDTTGPTVIVINQEHCGQENNHAANPPSLLHEYLLPLNVLTLALVIVAAITAWYVARQARETAKATQSMHDSIELQKAGLNQWVEIEDWQGGAEIWKPDIEPEQPDHLMFEFAIVNPTDHPITLKAAKWQIGGQPESIAPNCTLPPKGKHPTIASYDLTPEEMLPYAEKKKALELEVSGFVDFDDILHNARSQPFWLAFHCLFESGVWVTKFYKTAAWLENPKAKKTKPKAEEAS